MDKDSVVVDGFMIDSHVPAPTRHQSQKYPWAAMKDGDSFVVNPKGDGRKLAKSLQASARSWIKKHQDTHGGLRAIVRKRRDGYDGYRVWLIKESRWFIEQLSK